MITSRRRRLRITLFAAFALLWTQLAFAIHPACTPAVESLGMVGYSAVAIAHCDHDAYAGAASQVVCEGHCSQGDASSDVARVPPVPPLPGLPAMPRFALEVAPASCAGTLAHARCLVASSRGPTGHPAKILLI